MTKLIELTDSGLVYLTENQIYQLIVDKYREIDPAINLEPSEPDGYMAAWMAEKMREMVEAVIESYNSKDPSKARGVSLDIVSALTGSYRENGTPSVIAIDLTGTNGTEILAGSVIENDNAWSTDQTVVIGISGTVSTTATCSVVGSIAPDIGSVTNIKTTVGGWSGVTNTALVTLGTEIQGNGSFRTERKLAVARPGNSQADNAVGELFSVEDVLRVAAYENATGSDLFDAELNPHTLPKNSMSYVVFGGSDEDVAMAIYTKKNPGVFLNSVGTPVSLIVASQVHSTNTQLIKFGRPTLTNMIVVIELADPQSNLPADVQALIRESIDLYVNGNLIDADDGFDPTGFDIGENVPVRRIDTPINQIVGQYKGAYIDSLTINSLSTGAVTIAFDSISNWLPDNITVTVV